MSTNPKSHWDQRYRENARYDSFGRPRPFLMEQAAYLPFSGLALDIAMGLGGNAEFLLARGLRVIGVDISGVALRKAKARLPQLWAVQANLNAFYFPTQHFDALLNFFYLERSLWPDYERTLKPGGVLILETLTIGMQELRPDIDERYLLQPGELAAAFPHLETLVYEEGWTTGRRNHPRATARLIARKPQRA
ncbi:MAG TPA: class I SAM-dependent methyltransferase [Anaerolineales bacterium]|nr:class I SAM-dependent methyltransferase [Anaerolineales bacterium]